MERISTHQWKLVFERLNVFSTLFGYFIVYFSVALTLTSQVKSQFSVQLDLMFTLVSVLQFPFPALSNKSRLQHKYIKKIFQEWLNGEVPRLPPKKMDGETVEAMKTLVVIPARETQVRSARYATISKYITMHTFIIGCRICKEEGHFAKDCPKGESGKI